MAYCILGYGSSISRWHRHASVTAHNRHVVENDRLLELDIWTDCCRYDLGSAVIEYLYEKIVSSCELGDEQRQVLTIPTRTEVHKINA